MIVMVAGTRPELIKIAPVYLELKKINIPVELWMTGQHDSLVQAPLQFFDIKPSKQWKTLEPGQSSTFLLARLLKHLDEALFEVRPRAVIVQGDTTSALAGALAAFHRKIPIAHIEAGLRTGQLSQPFPEEMNRRVIDSFSNWLFAPTEGARNALIAEGHSNLPDPTGNTGIDALIWARDRIQRENRWPINLPRLGSEERLVLSTGHRSESLGSALYGWLHAIGSEVEQSSNVVLYHCAHPNPEATRNACEALQGFKKSRVIPSLNYPDFVALLSSAAVIISDSGGLQEEAPSFMLPLLITREVTERPETLLCGSVLVGTDPERVVAELRKVLRLKQVHFSAFQKTPFGDGQARYPIIHKILKDLGSNES